jgi:ketosteroid isomerase-like protein
MRAFPPFVALVAAFALAAPAAARDIAAETADAVRAADTAFAARAQVVPTAQAFREFMDETDGLQFDGPRPIRGAAAIYEFMGGEEPRRSRLEWHVADAWGSKGGDLGVTTGLWKSTSLTAARPPITGRYVTVWRRNAKGQWKGLIDIGNPDAPPQPAAATPAPATPPPAN